MTATPAPAPTPMPTPVPTPTPAASAAAADSALAAIEAIQRAAPVKDTPLDSDQWSPSKHVPAPAVEPEIPQVAKLPKPDNSIEAMMKIATGSEGKMPDDSDVWKPKSAALPKPDADISDDLK